MEVKRIKTLHELFSFVQEINGRIEKLESFHLETNKNKKSTNKEDLKHKEKVEIKKKKHTKKLNKEDLKVCSR